MSDIRCSHCEEPIGVYEPLITLADGHPRETSRAAEPHFVSHGVRCYHRNCFESIQGDSATEQ
jgi:hypothetical protein